MRNAIAFMAVLAVILASALAPAALAGPNADHKIAVHVVSHGVACKSLPVFTDCSEIVTTYAGAGDIDVIPVFYDVSEAGATAYGLTWPAEWGTCAYTQCWGDLTVGGIVNPGDGLSTAVLTCDSSWAIGAGYGWLAATGPGAVSIIPEPRADDLGIVACASEVLDRPSCTFSALIGSGSGEDPCGEADLSPLGIALDDGLGGACATRGEEVTYTLTYDNNANPSEVHGVYIVFTYGASASFVSATSGGVCKPEYNHVTWSMGTLAPGEEGSVQVVLSVLLSAGSKVSTTCSAAGDRTPTSSATLATPVCSQSLRPLDLTKSDGLGGACVNSGSGLTYALAYGNSGNSVTIHNVVLTDILPELVSFLSASGGGIYDSEAHAVAWSLGDLAQGASGSQTLTVTVNAYPGHTVANTCEILADEAVGRVRSISTTVCGQYPQNADHKVAIHVKQHGTACAAMPDFATCQDIATTFDDCGDLDFIPVFYDLNEVTSVQLAVTWPGEWGSCNFTLCPCDVSGGGIINPGDYVFAGWHTCRRSWAVAPGYGWLSAASPGLIIPQPGAAPFDDFGVWNCDSDETRMVCNTPVAVFRAGVCGEIGEPACGTMHTEPTTWGAIKAMFK